MESSMNGRVCVLVASTSVLLVPGGLLLFGGGSWVGVWNLVGVVGVLWVVSVGVVGGAGGQGGRARGGRGRRRPQRGGAARAWSPEVTMSGTGMEAMWELWCMDSNLENCPVRQIENATTLQTKVCQDSKLGKLNFCKIQWCPDRHEIKGQARVICLRWGTHPWMQKKMGNISLNHCAI